MDINLKDAVLEAVNGKKKERVVGRYSCSEIYAILNGWTTPEKFLNGEVFEFLSAFRMWSGTEKHKSIENLMKTLGYDVEIKKEMEVEGLTIVGICDFMDNNFVGDLKTSLEEIKEAKKWSLFQIKLYCTLFDRPKAYIYEPIMKIEAVPNKMGMLKNQVVDFYLREIGSAERDDKWFKKQIAKLCLFNDKVVEIVELTKGTKTA